VDKKSDADTFFAVHKSEVIYEQFGGYQNSSPTKKDATYVVNAPLHCAYCVETQKNIIFNDAGAIWGIRNENSSTVRQINLDPVMLSVYNSARDVDPGNSSGTSNPLMNIAAGLAAHAVNVSPDSIFNWNVKIVPDASYNALVPSLK